MAKIKIDSKLDRKLERVAPQFLKGPRRLTKRIEWAIGEVIDAKNAKAQPQRKAG